MKNIQLPESLIKSPDFLQKLLEVATEKGLEYQLVVRDARKTLSKLTEVGEGLVKGARLIKCGVNMWPGTVLLEGTATLFVGKLTQPWLQLTSGLCLDSFRQPELPEDLCLLKDGVPWLVSTTHENFAELIAPNNKIYEAFKQLL